MEQKRANLFQTLTGLGLHAEHAWRVVNSTFPKHDFKVVYLTHPIAGDVAGNLVHLSKVILALHHRHPEVIPFCPYYADAASLDDDSVHDRERALRCGRIILSLAVVDELWHVHETVTKGMLQEEECARRLGIPVHHKPINV